MISGRYQLSGGGHHRNRAEKQGEMVICLIPGSHGRIITVRKKDLKHFVLITDYETSALAN